MKCLFLQTYKNNKNLLKISLIFKNNTDFMGK